MPSPVYATWPWDRPGASRPLRPGRLPAHTLSFAFGKRQELGLAWWWGLLHVQVHLGRASRSPTARELLPPPRTS